MFYTVNIQYLEQYVYRFRACIPTTTPPQIIEGVTPKFTTDIYNESFKGGSYNMGTTVDFKVIARSRNSMTVRIDQRVTTEGNDNL